MLIQKNPMQFKFEILYNKYMRFIYVKTVSSNKESFVCTRISAELLRHDLNTTYE